MHTNQAEVHLQVQVRVSVFHKSSGSGRLLLSVNGEQRFIVMKLVT